MMEGLAKESNREVRASNYEMAIHGLSVYGLAMVLVQMHVPAMPTGPAVGMLAAAAVYRWLERRWAAERLDPMG